MENHDTIEEERHRENGQVAGGGVQNLFLQLGGCVIPTAEASFFIAMKGEGGG